MPKIYELSTSRARRARMTGRFAIAAIIAAAAIVVGTASFTSIDDLATAALADASATTRATASMETKSSTAGAPASSGDRARGFDYFPDHYVNQAKEPAEPIATF